MLTALVVAGCGDDAEDKFFCCSMRKLCNVCECDPHEQEIADSENEKACESWFEAENWEVLCSANGERYDETDAFAACSE